MNRKFPIVGILCAVLFQALELRAADTNALPAVLSPYLQHPTPGGMTICLPARTDAVDKVSIAFGTVSRTGAVSQPAKGERVPGTPWMIWKARLTNLSRGGDYAYTIYYSKDGSKGSTPTKTFHVPDELAESTRFAVFNDLHNRDATLAMLMKHVKPEDFYFTILLGDCWGDPSSAKGADQVFRSLDAYVRLLDAGSKPLLFVRGNHETRGNFSAQMAHLFDMPMLDASLPGDDQQWQYTLRAGPAAFLMLDTGEDGGAETPTNSYKRPLFWQTVRQRESTWLAARLAQGYDKDATWRIFVSHIPLYNNNPWFCEEGVLRWEPLLREWKPDLMLAGHDHGWKQLTAGKGYPVRRKINGQDVTESIKPPWPLLIGGGPGPDEATVMLVSADEKTLKVRMLAAKDGRVLTEYSASR